MKQLRNFTLAFTLVVGLFALTARAGDEPERIAFGEKVDILEHLVEGKTVIFDFTSHFCPPCEAIAPYLHKLHAKRDDIVVVEVDINREGVRGIDWQSPVAQQYGMNSIPHFKVYGPDGKLVAEGTEARALVVGWIQE
jgi:thiol-disulfide isomerase/thioredoxin